MSAIVTTRGWRGLFDRSMIRPVAASYHIASAAAEGPERPGAASRVQQSPGDAGDSADRLRFILARLPIGVITLSPAGRIVDCNPAALNLLGLGRDRVMNSTWFDLARDVVDEGGDVFPAELAPALAAIRDRRMVGGVIMGMSRPHRGDRVWLEMHAHPRMGEAGELREVICLFRDVSDRQRRRAAERLHAEADRRRHDAERQLQEGRLAQALPGESPATVRLRDEVQDAAHTLDDLPVLILGEPGTGKTLVAKTLHDLSSRRGGRFEAVNCAGISATLFESDVFGHEKGAFTGASASRPGRFELAHGGTLFLDEIGDLPVEQQAKLLVALQERSVRRLGAKSDTLVDIAVVAATNQDLPRMAVEGRFRADLYDRLNGVMIEVPPLRDRREDLEILVDRFVRAAGERRRDAIRTIDPEVLAAFHRFDWPGNVRQLYFVVRRMVGRARGDTLTIDLVPDQIRSAEPLRSTAPERATVLPKERIVAALAEQSGNVRRTAAHLGISRARLYRLMQKHGITPPR